MESSYLEEKSGSVVGGHLHVIPHWNAALKSNMVPKSVCKSGTAVAHSGFCACSVQVKHLLRVLLKYKAERFSGLI